MQNAYKNLQAIKKWNDMKTWVLYIFLNILIWPLLSWALISALTQKLWDKINFQIFKMILNYNFLSRNTQNISVCNAIN